MAGTISQSVPTDDHLLILWVPAIANINAPKLTELAAAGVKDVTYYFTADGWVPGGDQATVTDDRLTHPQTFEQPGKITNSLDITYVINPADPTNDVARLAFATNAIGFFVARPAVPHDQVKAVGDFVEVWPAKFGKSRRVQAAANDTWKNTQKVFITGPVSDDLVALVA